MIPGIIEPLSADRVSSAPTTTQESETTEETTSEPPSTSSTPDDPDTGVTASRIGQEEGFVSNAGAQVMTFTVDTIALNPGCNGSYPDPPSTGNFVIAAVTINILELVDGESPLFFTSFDWHIMGPNGVRDNENATFETYLCTADSEQFPSEPLGIGTYVGLVVMDTPHTSGQVIWTPRELGGLDGWSWTF